ncbi:hypothetical protein ACFFX0_33350 [Citricoccus parietis]|uniref:Uncharacterized protein n=1 Tax=Citricoccus parietis TaxID=592307 RepID=A0ABV5GBC2_9MICC
MSGATRTPSASEICSSSSRRRVSIRCSSESRGNEGDSMTSIIARTVRPVHFEILAAGF